ncbi:chromate transporter [Elioraea rosea]|uniref:chromate transporter n=1 Tax=Elioraea rosea TaxID=2492390 RepID=UPI001182DB86|nr:chromate transporter [Elioraea rosea]
MIALTLHVMAVSLGLSLLAVGGAIAVVPEVYRIAVDVNGWMSPQRFAELYAISQFAPGPNAMILALMGWEAVGGAAGGWVAGMAAMLAFVGPTSVISVLAFRSWAARISPSRQVLIRAALLPLSVALVASSGVLITLSLGAAPLVIAVASLVALTSAVTNAHPLLLIAGGAIAGAAATVF